MTFDELLLWASATTSDCMRRIDDSIRDLTEEAFNQSALDGLWGPGMIVEHLILSNAPYLESMQIAVQAAGPSSGSTACRHTFIGGQIRKLAGPTGNAPVPKALLPKSTFVPKSQAVVLREQTERLAELAQAASGKDLNAKVIRNPAIKLFRMNLADCFGIIADHMERHTQQIEQRALRPGHLV